MRIQLSVSILVIFVLLYRSNGNSAVADVPMKDNEAYATVSASYHVKTQPNEAYGTIVL